MDELTQALADAQARQAQIQQDADTNRALLGETRANLDRSTAQVENLRKKLEEQGVEITPGTPAEFGKLIAADMARWGRIVKETGSKAD